MWGFGTAQGQVYGLNLTLNLIDGLRKTGDAPGHKPRLASEASQNKEGGGTLPPPFQILKFKIFTKSKTWQFLELEARPGIIFWRYLRCFLHVPKFLHKKMQLQKLAKNR